MTTPAIRNVFLVINKHSKQGKKKQCFLVDGTGFDVTNGQPNCTLKVNRPDETAWTAGVSSGSSDTRLLCWLSYKKPGPRGASRKARPRETETLIFTVTNPGSSESPATTCVIPVVQEDPDPPPRRKR